MTLPRMPLTVWAWFINAILSMLIFSVLLAGTTAVLSDRLLGSNFFSSCFISCGAVAKSGAPGKSSRSLAAPVLVFRASGSLCRHAAVFRNHHPSGCHVFASAHLEGTAGCARTLRSRRRRILRLGLPHVCHRMNPYAPLVFSVLASSLGIPATLLLASWFGTLWDARIQLPTAVLFAVGFISLFVAGGLSGIFLARHELRQASVSEDFVVGHFHLVMGVAATFAILGALFFWFPKMFGCRLNETLGKIHFWMTFAGVYAIFMPLHWLGLLTQSRSAS